MSVVTETPARADPRPLPGRGGLRRARRRPRLLGAVRRRGRPTFLLPPTWEIVALAAPGRCRSPTSRGTPGVAHLRPARQRRSDRPGPTATRTAYREFAEDAVAVLDATGVERAIVVGCCDGGGWALMLAAEHPERRAGVVVIAPCVPRRPAHPNYAGVPVRRGARHRRGLGEENRHYWLRDFRGLPRVLLLAELHRAALDEADRGLRRLGLETDAETLALADGWEAPLMASPRGARSASAFAARSSSSTATRTMPDPRAGGPASRP